MSAACTPIVFAAGGPGTIVEDGVTGFHFHDLVELVAVTRRVLEGLGEAERDSMRAAAEASAQSYSEASFMLHVREITARVGAGVTPDAEGQSTWV
jgi:hypothetical protein